MRLSEGTNATYGAVQVYENNTWNLVCGDGWTDSTAALVCQEMGLADGKVVPRSGFTVNESDTMIFATCYSSSTSFSDCVFRPGAVSSCTSGFYASVFCSDTVSPSSSGTFNLPIKASNCKKQLFVQASLCKLQRLIFIMFSKLKFPPRRWKLRKI